MMHLYGLPTGCRSECAGDLWPIAPSLTFARTTAALAIPTARLSIRVCVPSQPVYLVSQVSTRLSVQGCVLPPLLRLFQSSPPLPQAAAAACAASGSSSAWHGCDRSPSCSPPPPTRPTAADPSASGSKSRRRFGADLSQAPLGDKRSG